jgi:3',5'-cyclic AMP phosphodiesterase CpdA
LIERLEAHLRALLGGAHDRRTPAGAGPVVRELVDPTFVKGRLADVRAHAGDQGRSAKIADEHYEAAFEDLDRAAREQPGQPYMPRSATASLAQSALSRCIESRIEHVLDALPRGDSAIDRAIQSAVSIFRRFGPCDPGWIETKIAEGIALFEGRPEFPNQPAAPVPFAADARVIVVGDWGTGLAGAVAVGQQMRSVLEATEPGRECHVIHLGDVYYSGWPEEYQDRFLRYWPVARDNQHVLSWSLNGNHDMYSGGHGYFDVLLRDPRFRGHHLPDGTDHHTSSHFSLENDHWQVLGLDTGYLDHDLAGDQATWVKGKLRPDRKTMLLTHHQPFSSFEQVSAPMLANLEPAFDVRKIDAWLWGHEHRAIIYERNDAPYLDFGACIGHGGIPVLMEGVEIDDHPKVKWALKQSQDQEGNRWGLHGFAILDFEGPAMHIAFVDENGQTNYQEQAFT